MRPRIRPTQVITLTLFSFALPVVASSAGDLPETVTWSEHIAPLVREHCASCHQPGDIAPMSLLSYDEARPWAKSIRRVVAEGDMPPWHADPGSLVFKNDRSLSERERALIERWTARGAPRGADSPPIAAPTSGGWRLGQPDRIVSFNPVDLPAGGPDVFHDLVVDLGLDRDVWLRAVEVKPGNRTVLHHVILYSGDGKSAPESGWLGAWAAGMGPMEFPQGTARRIRKGDGLIGDMHYHPAAEAARDQTQVGLYFYPGEPEKELVNLWIQNSDFEIPAGRKGYEVRSSFVFPQDSVVHALLPHMHYRGKDFSYTARYPDGRSETLLTVSNYDFNWQTLYELAQPLEVPAGTRIDCLAHFDNSADNPHNPDASRNVPVGNESFDEMMIGFVDYTVREGQAPMTVAERLARLERRLLAAGGELFRLEVQMGPAGGTSLDTLLHLTGAGAVWYIPMQGQLLEATSTAVERSAGAFKADFAAPFGRFTAVAAGEGDALSGSITLPQGNETLEFAGARVGQQTGP
jgi:hypothetical protein